jgi:hypothetical protein
MFYIGYILRVWNGLIQFTLFQIGKFNSKVEQLVSRTVSWNGLCWKFEVPFYHVHLYGRGCKLHAQIPRWSINSCLQPTAYLHIDHESYTETSVLITARGCSDSTSINVLFVTRLSRLLNALIFIISTQMSENKK